MVILIITFAEHLLCASQFCELLWVHGSTYSFKQSSVETASVLLF